MSEINHPIELFCSYAPQDEQLRVEIEKHLRPLVEEKQINLWYHQRIPPGTNRVREIDTHLNTAQIILLLISSDFMGSNYCYSTEMQRALERHKAQNVRVIPILLRPFDWQATPIGYLEPLPTNHKPITIWDNQDEAWVNVAQGIRRIVERLTAPSIPQSNHSPATGVIVSSEASRQNIQSTQSMSSQTTNAMQQEPATVFLGYVQSDTEIVKDLQLRLKLRGLRTWREKEKITLESLSKNEITQAFKQEVDALVLYITPNSLKQPARWRQVVLTALSRHKKERAFRIFPVLHGVTAQEFQQFALNQGLTELAYVQTVSFGDGTSVDSNEEQHNTQMNKVAGDILLAALTHHLLRRKADQTYEPHLYLQMFPPAPAVSLDLDLDWTDIRRDEGYLLVPREWDRILIPALDDVKESLSQTISSHRFHFYAQCRLSVALALGFTFRAPARFILFLEDVKVGEERTETWSTDVLPAEEEPLRQSREDFPQGNPLEAVIGLDATEHSIKERVKGTLSALGIAPGYYIHLEIPERTKFAITNAAHAQAIAQQVRRVCRDLCNQQGIKHIHLFASIPAALGVLIGHQLNTICPITFYEWQHGTQTYRPAGTLPKMNLQ